MVYNIWTKTEKIKVFTTNILASKDREHLFYFAIIAFTFCKGPSKLSLDTSPNLRNTPKYLTGDDPTVTLAKGIFLPIEGSNAMVLSKLRVRPVKDLTNSIYFNTMDNYDISLRKIAISSAYSEHGSSRNCYHSK